MTRKFLLGWILLFVVWMVGSFVVHGGLLSADYTALQGKLFRTTGDSHQYFPLMILAHLLLSGSLVWIYSRGCEAAKPWLGQGVRFGIAIALLTTVPTYIIYFVVQPMPGSLAIKQIVFDGALTVVLGVVVAWWYRGQDGRVA
jgi:hypothetical protein